MAGTRTAKNLKKFLPSKVPVPCECPGAKRISSGTAQHGQTLCTKYLNSESHPKPKRHGALQPGLSTGLCHFKSQQFVLSRVRHFHQKLSQFMNRSTSAPLVLFKVSIGQSAILTFSIHQEWMQHGYRFRNQHSNQANKPSGRDSLRLAKCSHHI